MIMVYLINGSTRHIVATSQMNGTFLFNGMYCRMEFVLQEIAMSGFQFDIGAVSSDENCTNLRLPIKKRNLVSIRD
jgi:hypothetical protein